MDEVIKVKVCVGSSCHIKGSYDVIDKLNELILKEQLDDKIVLEASFCLGNCLLAVNLLANEILIHNLNINNCEEKFYSEIKPLIK
ncbi:MAG: (2Fe-2S) ferredoxin domain-containing protein [Acholeplasmatales bacterium]|jgi:NADH:ubiquinone oxidoreductase subunit E|nr:(2Fe-2S) ferredoxin domain-containing protein [Acholeplasmatales bacterium]